MAKSVRGKTVPKKSETVSSVPAEPVWPIEPKKESWIKRTFGRPADLEPPLPEPVAVVVVAVEEPARKKRMKPKQKRRPKRAKR